LRVETLAGDQGDRSPEVEAGGKESGGGSHAAKCAAGQSRLKPESARAVPRTEPGFRTAIRSTSCSSGNTGS
jgi:hypothetical protein